MHPAAVQETAEGLIFTGLQSLDVLTGNPAVRRLSLMTGHSFALRRRNGSGDWWAFFRQGPSNVPQQSAARVLAVSELHRHPGYVSLVGSLFDTDDPEAVFPLPLVEGRQWIIQQRARTWIAYDVRQHYRNVP